MYGARHYPLSYLYCVHARLYYHLTSMRFCRIGAWEKYWVAAEREGRENTRRNECWFSAKVRFCSSGFVSPFFLFVTSTNSNPQCICTCCTTLVITVTFETSKPFQVSNIASSSFLLYQYALFGLQRVAKDSCHQGVCVWSLLSLWRNSDILQTFIHFISERQTGE